MNEEEKGVPNRQKVLVYYMVYICTLQKTPITKCIAMHDTEL